MELFRFTLETDGLMEFDSITTKGQKPEFDFLIEKDTGFGQ